MKSRYGIDMCVIAPCATVLAVSISSCALVASVDRDEIYAGGAAGFDPGFGGMGAQGGSGGQAGLGGQGGSGGLAGAGGGPECQTPSDCVPPANECVFVECTDGMCVTTNVSPGTSAASQASGDCLVEVCDGNGSIVTQYDDADVHDDGKDCTKNLCTMGTPFHPLEAQGAPCSELFGNVCNESGTCVECNVNADCMTLVCQDSQCRAAECGNGTKDGAEVDVDCGGACGRCADGKTCTTADDCKSNVCTMQTCAVPTCNDSVKNGAETDIDCGGSCMEDCADGKGCKTDADCVNMSCTAATMTCATCVDGLKNATETDVDCGGACPDDCANGKGCTVDGDCSSAMCHANLCMAKVNECDVNTATDLTAFPATTVIFQLFYYLPKCVKVKVGTVITFSGDFVESPLQGGLMVNGVPIAVSTGPFVPVTSTGTSKDFVMTTPGTFPYYCVVHGSLGMNGAVFVVP